MDGVRKPNLYSCLRVTSAYNAAETLVLTSLLRSSRTRALRNLAKTPLSTGDSLLPPPAGCSPHPFPCRQTSPMLWSRKPLHHFLPPQSLPATCVQSPSACSLRPLTLLSPIPNPYQTPPPSSQPP